MKSRYQVFDGGASLWKVAHVRRGANLLAHNLPKWAFSETLDVNIPVRCISIDILMTFVSLIFRNMIIFNKINIF